MLSVATAAPTSFGAAEPNSKNPAKRPLRTQPVVTIMPLLIDAPRKTPTAATMMIVRNEAALAPTAEFKKFTASLLDRLPNLRLIATTGLRNRGIDVAHAKTKGVIVAGTSGKGNSTLEHIWALILATVRYVVVEDARTKAGAVPWQSTIPMGLAGKTLGLVGVGNLGTATGIVRLHSGLWLGSLCGPCV